MKRFAVSLAAIGLFACTPEAKPPAATGAGAVAACSGPVTPIAGVCTTAAGVFQHESPRDQLLDTRCVWTVDEVQRAPGEVLLFRVQDCSAMGSGAYRFSYAFPNPTDLTATLDMSPEAPIAYTIASVFDIPEGKTAEDVAMTKLADAPEAERSRCKTRSDGMGATFQLAPDDTFLAELQKDQDGPISACGPFGYTEDSQVWWEAHGPHAIFHATGQDTPSWDPTQFIFYKQDSSGAWMKEAGPQGH